MGGYGTAPNPYEKYLLPGSGTGRIRVARFARAAARRRLAGVPSRRNPQKNAGWGQWAPPERAVRLRQACGLKLPVTTGPGWATAPPGAGASGCGMPWDGAGKCAAVDPGNIRIIKRWIRIRFGSVSKVPGSVPVPHSGSVQVPSSRVREKSG